MYLENAKVYSAPYVLCHPIPMPPADSADETATSLMASMQNASVLYCGYCLSHDDNYLLAVCTDSVGELIESCVISVEPCLRPTAGNARLLLAQRHSSNYGSFVKKNRPTILGTSLTSLEPEPSIRLYMARALPKVSSLFEGVSNTRTSVGAVPKPDVSRTYIAVMQ
ncbi:mediator complex subunit Srb9 [Desmophyllum pertusum]|uniref:Mediator of RNA polymerase II transcription subunit 13 n=1 Tax=Desmophyllum pertusum TaxID=174260 RepID=A0A9X0CPY7_9CNID|nr:mediator complex subunit Srb9 [Desmophyllum pertusum]